MCNYLFVLSCIHNSTNISVLYALCTFYKSAWWKQIAYSITIVMIVNVTDNNDLAVVTFFSHEETVGHVIRGWSASPDVTL